MTSPFGTTELLSTPLRKDIFSPPCTVLRTKPLLLLYRNDYADHRQGNRVVGIGEKPYFDPSSRSRRDDLKLAF